MLSSTALWTGVVILLLPAAVIGMSELEERLRQAQSPFRRPVATTRDWALPLFAVWAILVPVLGVEADSVIVTVVASGFVIAVATAALQLLAILVDGLRTRPRRDGRGPIPQLLLALPRILLLLTAGWILIAGVWGVDLSAALTALGVTSLVVSFALQDTLSGLASGFLLVSDQPFQPGDWIEADDVEGVVVDLNWRTTRVKTRSGDLVVVPNSQLANASIVNYSTPEPLHRVEYPVQVAFVNPPTIARNMLLDAARATPGVLEEPPPEVRVVQTDDPLMGYEVHMWVADYSVVPRVKSDFGALVWYQSQRQGVPLPSPAQDLFLHPADPAEPPPGQSEIRSGLETSPLFGMLDDDELDRVVAGSRYARFAQGELMVTSAPDDRDLLVIVTGRARLVLIEPGGDDLTVGDVSVGDTIGVVEGSRLENRVVAARAVTDCEVVVIDADVAGQVSSRNAALATALNRLGAIRARRVDRLVTARAAQSPSHDEDASA
jgi:small-conductance mechanosensitive channel